MNITLNVYGNTKQTEAVKAWLDPVISDIVYGGSKGSGKSFLGCSLIFGDALMYPGTHYFIARKKLNDLRKYTIPSIHEVFDIWGIHSRYYKYNGQDNYFEMHNGSKVFLLDAKPMPSDPTYARFGSMQNTRGWIEEAGDFDPAAKNNLAASIGRWKNKVYNLPPKLLQTCNPTKNYLYTDYYKPFKNNELPDYKAFIQAFPEDNKRLDPKYLENLNRILDKNQKERLLFGNWEYDDDPATLIDIEAIYDYFNPVHIKPEGQRYLTIDCARKGKDKAVYRVWHGWLCIHREAHNVTSVPDMIRIGKELQQKYNIPASHTIADEDGVGGGVVDGLRCKGFVNNSSPIEIIEDGKKVKPNYENLKAQCTINMAKVIMDRKAGEICNDAAVKETVLQEMEQVKIKSLYSDGKMGVMGKEHLHKVLNRSPDDWDSIMMRYYFELNAPPVFDLR